MFPSGVKQNLTYDGAGRIDLLTLKTAANAVLQSFDYDYGFDASGNRTATYRFGLAVKLSKPASSVTSYTYDDLARLSSASRTGSAPTYAQSYAYDLANNRTSLTTTSSYDAANQLTASGATAYNYDRDGNLTAYGGNTLSYNAAKQWTAGSSLAYTWDGLGRQVSRSQAGSRTDLWFDQSGRDRLGSVTAQTSTAQTLSGSLTYDPWGQPRQGTAISAQAAGVG